MRAITPGSRKLNWTTGLMRREPTLIIAVAAYILGSRGLIEGDWPLAMQHLAVAGIGYGIGKWIVYARWWRSGRGA
jgi:hypothetical protein